MKRRRETLSDLVYALKAPRKRVPVSICRARAMKGWRTRRRLAAARAAAQAPESTSQT